jgi:hypothetical protein
MTPAFCFLGWVLGGRTQPDPVLGGLACFLKARVIKRFSGRGEYGPMDTDECGDRVFHAGAGL